MKMYIQILFMLICFLHGKYIGGNKTVGKPGKPGLAFIVDFEKAFDKVRLEFLYTVYSEHF